MPHRSLNALVFAGLEPTTAATVISLLGDEGLPQDLRIVQGLGIEPWQSTRTGLMIIGMKPDTDLVRVSQLIENRTTYWDVAVCLPQVLSYYSVALLAQGALKVLTHPEDDLDATKRELRWLLNSVETMQSDAFGLEIADLIQLYGEKRMSKTLRLTGDGCVGSIFLHNGNVVHAETMDDQEGMDAFKRLINLRNPELRVHKGCLTDKKTMGIPAMTALLEGSRQHDESTRESNTMIDHESLDLEPNEFGSLDGIPKLDLQRGDIPITARNVPPPPSADRFDPLRDLFRDDELDRQ